MCFNISSTVSLRFFLILNSAYIFICPQVSASNISVGVEYSIINDSNFSRTNVMQGETISTAVLSFNLEQSFSKQQVKAALIFNNLYYENNEALDSSYETGEFVWQGRFGRKMIFDVIAKRNAYAVDQLEFKGKDVVSKNELVSRAGYGSREKLSLWIGGSSIEQEHSAFEREVLNFEQEALFIEMIVHSSGGVEHHVALTKGDRIYQTGMNTVGDVIDFDYRQYSDDLTWVLADSHQFTLGVAQFERFGQLNSDTGNLWNGRWVWHSRPKLSLHAGFELNQPALGEEMESPSEIRDTTLGLRWQVSERWFLATDFLHSDQTYITQSTYIQRTEIWQRWRPFIIGYSLPGWFSARLDTEFYERQSDSMSREYEGARVQMTLTLSF
jgi:hypothetical protein